MSERTRFCNNNNNNITRSKCVEISVYPLSSSFGATFMRWAAFPYCHENDGTKTKLARYSSKTSLARTLRTQTLSLRGLIFWGPAKSPWF